MWAYPATAKFLLIVQVESIWVNYDKTHSDQGIDLGDKPGFAEIPHVIWVLIFIYGPQMCTAQNE